MTTSPPNFITTDWNWLKAHAALLLLAGGLAGGAVYGFETLQAKRDAAIEARDDAKLAAATAQTASAQQTLVTVQQQLLVMVQQLQAQNAQLEKSKTVRDTQTQKQVQNDQTLSAAETAQRLSTQTQAQAGEIVANADTVVMDLPMSRRVVGDLDLLGTAQADLVDTKQELNNETQLFNKSQDENAQNAKVIQDLQNQNKLQVVACQARIKTIKAQARKSKFKIATIAYVAGVVTGYLLRIF